MLIFINIVKRLFVINFSFVSVSAGVISPIVVHTNSTAMPAILASFNSTRLNKGLDVNLTDPPASQTPSTTTKIIIPPKNSSKNAAVIKTAKAYNKKTDYILQNVTARNKTKDKETVINPRANETNLIEPYNVTEGRVLVNSSFTGVPQTDNLTYMQEDVNTIQNLEKVVNSEVEEKAEGLQVIDGQLSAAGITGITLGCVVTIGVLCGVSYFMYHNRGSNRPQVLNDHCSNPDSSGYIDDASVRVSN